MEKLKVVFHINEEGKWNVLLGNVNNLIKDLGKENIIIEVVANGVAVVSYMSNGKVLDKISELSEVGVNFAACKNALRMNQIEQDALPKFIQTVPAGVTELIKKQSQGYAYIKP